MSESARRSPRILHIAESTLGGCGTYLNELVPLQIASLGARQVRCIVPAPHRRQLRDVPNACVDVFERAGRLAGLPRLAAATLRAVRTWKPDVVHAHSTFAGAIVRLLGLVVPMPPVVYCAHGWVFEVFRKPWQRSLTQRIERLLARRSAAIVAISDGERRQGVEAGIPADKLVVVHNGVARDSDAHSAEWDDARVRVLFVGRLDRQKGADILVEAVRGLADHVDVRLVGQAVVGDTQSQAWANLPPHVRCLGWLDRPDVASQMRAADVVVMPSRWEGFGLVAIEAMRAGKAVIASDVGGLPEVVVDGATGRLFPSEDATALEAILRECSRPQLADWGRAGRARFVAHFTSDRMAAGLRRVYRSVLEESVDARWPVAWSRFDEA
jgi:glycosyltransferase involved in cell wall biosynthesis